MKQVMNIFVRALLFIFIILLFVLLFQKMSYIGYNIFSDEAMDAPSVARETMVTVEKDDSVLDISKKLSDREIVNNAYVFALSIRCMDGYKDIVPGEYKFSSSQKPSEILDELTNKGEQKE